MSSRLAGRCAFLWLALATAASAQQFPLQLVVTQPKSAFSILNGAALSFTSPIGQTATAQVLRNDADNATIGTSTVSDDGTTFTRGKFS